jgi:hypothetical protein
MSRNKLGQFEPGVCGNLRGRPRKPRRKVDYNKARSDFFETAEKLVPFNENGKRTRIPLSIAIERQLAMKAATGDLRAIIEWQKIQRRYTVEYQNEQLGAVEQLMQSEKFMREHPEDVTDEYKALIGMLRRSIDPDNLP